MTRSGQYPGSFIPESVMDWVLVYWSTADKYRTITVCAPRYGLTPDSLHCSLIRNPTVSVTRGSLSMTRNPGVLSQPRNVDYHDGEHAFRGASNTHIDPLVI